MTNYCINECNFRRSFFNYQYIMVFFNTAIGLFSCLLRIIKSIVFGIWLLPRLDCSTLSRNLERFDLGFISYVSLIKMENHHTNPILVVFTSLLLDSTPKLAMMSGAQELPKIATVDVGKTKST